MLPELIHQFLNSYHQKTVKLISAVGGGSINETYRYSVDHHEFFIKYNNQVEGVIEKEVEGLKAISSLNAISTPEVIVFDKIAGYELVVLPFISEGLKTSKAWENFGRQLAQMHAQPAPFFGWHQNNFIGSLSQANIKTYHFIDFFVHQRLKPQIELAQNQQYLTAQELNQFEKLFEKLKDILPDSQPSLVHGDLWSGNFIIGEQDAPYLIDPSIHYNYRETDIAFTHLFGAFDSKFYEAYNQHFPLAPGFQERIALYNIYPLLVHLNLFGPGYYHAVMNNLKYYS